MIYLLEKLNILDVIPLPNESSVEVSVFIDVFKDVPEFPTYDDFMEIDKENKGYKTFFDKCKSEGILN